MLEDTKWRVSTRSAASVVLAIAWLLLLQPKQEMSHLWASLVASMGALVDLQEPSLSPPPISVFPPPSLQIWLVQVLGSGGTLEQEEQMVAAASQSFQLTLAAAILNSAVAANLLLPHLLLGLPAAAANFHQFHHRACLGCSPHSLTGELD